MKSRSVPTCSPLQLLRELCAIVCIGVIAPGTAMWAGDVQTAQTGGTTPQTAATDQAAAKLPPDQLDSLVAPIALYPDPMLSQTLVASTYPLEIIQLKQWMDQHKNLQGKALAEAVAKQDWDPSIQSMAGLPEVVKLLSENIKWTTDLGNAFLAQQDDVMAAVQRMRQKAQSNGNLKSSEQQKVEVKTVESKQVIVIEQASPEVVYVPSYNPTVVYGAPVYAYPPIAYPPPGYYAAGMAISFGVGVAMGAFWGGGGWCCNSGWNGGNNNININNNNNFVRNSNRQNVGNGNRQNIGNGNRASQMPAGGRSNWQHNPQHRGGAPYWDRRLPPTNSAARLVAIPMQNRQSNARQDIGRQQGSRAPCGGIANKPGGPATGNHEDSGDRGGPAPARVTCRNRGAGGNESEAGAVATALETNGCRTAPAELTERIWRQSGTSGRDARASQSRGASSTGGSRVVAVVDGVVVAAAGGDRTARHEEIANENKINQLRHADCPGYRPHLGLTSVLPLFAAASPTGCAGGAEGSWHSTLRSKPPMLVIEAAGGLRCAEANGDLRSGR